MDLEQKSIERIKLAAMMSEQYYDTPLICTYSGGKDSDVMLELFKRSGVNFEVVNSHTTVDAPQTVYHIREKFKELEEQGIKATIIYPAYRGKRTSMWEMIVKKGPPTRIHRWCCTLFKEKSAPGRMIATGVRWDESVRRARRGEYETAGKTVDGTPEGDLIMALNMAIEALEKQIPKKPKGKDDNFDMSYGICPNCNNIVDDWNDNRFCNECGQAISWEGME